MPEPKLITARGVAAEVLTETRKDKQFAGDALDQYPKLANRQKATDLVFSMIIGSSSAPACLTLLANICQRADVACRVFAACDPELSIVLHEEIP